MVRLESAIGTLRDLVGWVRRESHTPQPVETDLAGYAVVSLFSACPPLTSGILTLLGERLGSPALVLTRVLFEHSIRLGQFAEASETRRLGLVVHWLNDGLNQSRGLMSAYERLGDGPDPALRELAKAKVERQRAALVGRRATLSNRDLRGFGSIRDASVRLGRLEDWVDYVLASQFVHGSEPSGVFRRQPREDRVAEFDSNADMADEGQVTVAAFAGSSLLSAYAAAASTMGWSLPDDAQRFAARLEEMGHGPISVLGT